jgi:serine/threonine protein kinase
LIGKLLEFNPDKRISVVQAIRHEYFDKFRRLENPPVSNQKFNWDWEEKNINRFTIPLVKRIIFQESLVFNPLPQEGDGLKSQQSSPEARQPAEEQK